VIYVKIEDVLEAGKSFSKSIEKINKILNDQSINNTLEELKLYVNALSDLLNKRTGKFSVSVNEHGGVLVFHKYIPDVLLYYTPIHQDEKISDLLGKLMEDEEFKKTLAERILSTMALLSMMLAESIKKTIDSSL
jgi:hypothetical protein